MQKAAVYVRSADKSGIAAQLEACRKFAKENNYQIVSEYLDEGASGAHLIRPGLTKLREDMAAKKFGTVIVQDLSRWTRNVIDYAVLKSLFQEYGVTVEFLEKPSSNNAAESYAKVITKAAYNFHKNLISNRIKRGLQEKRSKEKAKRPVRLAATGSLSGN